MNKAIKQNGFTLLELTVSVSIIVLMTLVFLLNFRTADDSLKLRTAAETLISDIRLAQNHSLGFLESVDDVESLSGGWGVNFKKEDDFYTIFVDIDGDGFFDAGNDYEYYVGDLPKGVSIKSLQLVDSYGTETDLNNLNLVFLPPLPTVLINNVEDSSGRVILENKSGLEMGAFFNFFGLIDIYEP